MFLIRVADYLLGEELLIQFTVHFLRERMSICECASFPFGFGSVI